MALLVSAKGTDILAWRASGEFAATYRQLMLARLEYCRAGEADKLLLDTAQALDSLIEVNQEFIIHSTSLISQVAECTEPHRLREFTVQFFSGLYNHVGIHHSAPAFYEYSTLFLHALSGSINRFAHTSLGLLGRRLPPVKLIALGPAGRQEFSPFCPLQTMLVHGETGDAEREAISQLGRLLHEGFEECGLLVDEAVTPRNHEWRGSMTDWQRRLAKSLEHPGAKALIELFRLADQTPLCNEDGFDPEIGEMCRTVLQKNRPAMAFQVTRVLGLSHGIGIMGGMRFERKGPYRGLFALRDNGLQPLSAAVGVLALFKKLETVSTPQRVREILWRRELNVDMAERLLLAWHTLHEIRLNRERDIHPDWTDEAPLYLDIDEMGDTEQNLLRESLDSVGALQRHVGLTFSGMEG